MKLFGKELKFNNYNVYHTGNKPTVSEIGAATASHTHNSITNQDTRNVNTTPTQMPLGLSVHLKSNSTDGLNDGGTYHSTLMIKGWNDVSGGPWGQMAVTANNNLYFRSSNSDTWNAWKKVSLDGHTHSNYAASSHTHSGYAAASHDHPAPASGSYWNNGYLKVNGDGVMEGGKYFDFHNTNATTSDYSTRLMCTGDTKNEVQLPSGSGTIGLMRHANDYWGLVPPDGNGENWIRTTKSGLIPYQSGSASNIGTESWRFTNGYFGYLDASGMIRARDRFEVANSSGTAQFGVGGNDSFWYNQKANKYVQFKNNGTFCISDSEFYHRGHNIIDAADRSSGDSGFGNSSKPCGFIGRFPGWNSNCLYINTWSNGGAESASYGIVKIKGSQVQHDGFITIQGTPVSVQSSAPSVGGVWIQI